MMKTVINKQIMSTHHGQRGVVLIACMIVLLIITLLGTTAMQGSGMELRMVKNFELRQQVFQAAEATLRAAETQLSLTPFTDDQLDTGTCTTPSSCFDNTCSGGLCFMGDNSQTAELCTIYDDPNTPDADPATLPKPEVPIWLDDGTLSTTWGKVWGDANKTNFFGDLHTGSSDITTEYIIEFQCFLEITGPAYLPFYRITVLGEHATGSNQVMLQSTYTTARVN